MEDRMNKAEEHISELKEVNARMDEKLKTIDNKIDRLFKKQDEMCNKIDAANKEKNERISELEDFKYKVKFAGKTVMWTTGTIAASMAFAAKVLPYFGIVLV